MQAAAWGIALLVGIGCALMFAPAYWVHLTASGLFIISGLWGAMVLATWARSIKRWTMAQGLKVGGIAVAGFVLMALLVGVALQAPGAEAQSKASPQVAITGGDNVVSVGQIGGITARVVNINSPMRPEFRIRSKTDVANADGSHTVTITGDVASPITPGLLSLQIEARGMRDASIMAAPVGGISSTELRNVRKMKDFYSAEVPSPHGEYIITVVTSGTPEVRLSASF